MVATKKRGGKAGPASKKAAAKEDKVEETVETPTETQTESEMQAEESNTTESSEVQAETEEKSEETTEAVETETESKPEPVEPGKILVDNLPSSLLFNYQERMTELFSKHGEIKSIKRGPIIVSELTTTPTLSAIVEFKNKDSLEKAMSEDGTMIDNNKIRVEVQPSTVDTTLLVGVPFETTNEYVHHLLSECGEIAQLQEYSKSKYKILRVTFNTKESLEKALKLDRDIRINGFLMTITKYREDDDNKQQSDNKGKNQRNNSQNNSRNNTNYRGNRQQNNFNANNNAFRGQVGGRANRGGFAGGRGGGNMYGGRAPAAGGFNIGGGPYMGGGFMGAGYMNEGPRPNKRMRQM